MAFPCREVSTQESPMTGLNKDKVKWVVIIGAPKLEHLIWKFKVPSKGDLRDVVATDKYQRPIKFSTKVEAQAWIDQRSTLQHKYHLRVEKMRPIREKK